jgi:hypothetical protein
MYAYSLYPPTKRARRLVSRTCREYMTVRDSHLSFLGVNAFDIATTARSALSSYVRFKNFTLHGKHDNV